MKIVHVSDTHGKFPMLPKADLYVVTGDVYPNFCTFKYLVPTKMGDREVLWDPNGPVVDPSIPKFSKPQGFCVDRITDPAREERLQKMWAEKFVSEVGGNYRRLYLANPEAPVILCRGNHDFTDLSPLFSGGPVWEVDLDSEMTFEFGGLKVGGMRGINYIGGEWSDEMSSEELRDQAGRLPQDLDLLVSHAPPEGVLDNFCAHFGVAAMATYHNVRAYSGAAPKPPLAHFFGHIHENGGKVVTLGGTLFSNGATKHNVVEL